MNIQAWHEEVPNAEEFSLRRKSWIDNFTKNEEIRKVSIDLQIQATELNHGYFNSWLGVPIIRLAEDLLMQQELITNLRPEVIIEIGIARGGGLLFNASIQSLNGISPRVIGIDNIVHPHTYQSINESIFSKEISILVADSLSIDAVKYVESAVGQARKCLLILDSNHTADHVYQELISYGPLLPPGSLIIVCDTLIDEFPKNFYSDRTWSENGGPLAAIESFLDTHSEFGHNDYYGKRSLITECRSGVLEKIL
jgi:cephalosporin hydroxylase